MEVPGPEIKSEPQPTPGSRNPSPPPPASQWELQAGLHFKIGIANCRTVTEIPSFTGQVGNGLGSREPHLPRSEVAEVGSSPASRPAHARKLLLAETTFSAPPALGGVHTRAF